MHWDRRFDRSTPTRPLRPELLGEAFGQLIERLDPTRLPRRDGVNATVVVTLDDERLLSGLGTARLDTGQPLSAGEARRLACAAGIIPAVVRHLVDGRSVVLDMGRKRRFHTEHMRITLSLQGDAQCAIEGCTRPFGNCHAHHLLPWFRGGGTSVANGLLLCPVPPRESALFDARHAPSSLWGRQIHASDVIVTEQRASL